jgi:hypothetical protein
MRYEEPRRLTKVEAETVFARGAANEIREALVSVALNEHDWRWVQEQCLTFARHDDRSMRAVAATCLGHVARIHGQLDLDRVMPILAALLKDPATAGYAETAIDDVNTFVRTH